MAASNFQSLQNSLRRNQMFRQPLRFTHWLPKHPVFWFTPNAVSQATYGYLPLTVQQLCDLRDVMPRHWSLRASHPTPYLGKQRISLGVAIILNICLCSHTQFDCNQFTVILNLHLSKDFNKKYRAAATLISSHEGVEQHTTLISNHKARIKIIAPSKNAFRTWVNFKIAPSLKCISKQLSLKYT